MNNVPVDWSLILSASLLSFPSVPLANHPYTREALIEFGGAVASRLKLSPDGMVVLWPQPSDDPEDPQNVRPCLQGVIGGIIDLTPFSGLNGGRPSNW